MAIELIKGAALLLTLSLLQGFIRRYWRENQIHGQIISGVLFGSICIIGMMSPLVISSGVIFDARSVVLSMSGLFGGPIVGGIAAVMAGSYRHSIGGDGVAVGIAVVISCVTLGLIYRYCHQKNWIKVGFFQLLAFGLLVHIFVIILFTQLPTDVAQKVLNNVAIPLVLVFTPAVAFLGLLLQDIEKRLSMKVSLQKNENGLRTLFETSEVSIWNEDFSAVYKALEQLRQEGVTNLRQHLNDHGQKALELADLVKVIQVNKATLKLFGASTQREFLFKLQDTFGSTAIEVFKDQLCAIWEGHKSFRAEAEFKTFDDQILNCIISLPIPETEEEFSSIPVNIIDITERKKMEEELRIALVNAEQANKAKSEFLASMSHELRTPLNAVLGFAQMLQYNPQAPLLPAQTEQVENILQGGYHLLELVNEILDLAQVEANQIKIFIDDVDAKKVVADCVNLMAPIGEPRGIKIIDQFSSEPSVLLLTDHTRLKQVLINFLSNAVKFNKDGGTVTIEGRESVSGFLRISVADTGEGIAEEDFSNIFNFFNRLNADSMIATEGTGIGLTVTKLLVERMAGRTGFDSEVGVGSTFWIDLPLASNEDVFIWTDAINVGVDAIDKDHQVLLSLYNRVTHRSSDETNVDDVIAKLIDYTRYHFEREEALMEVCDYPNVEEHRELHRKFVKEVSAKADMWRKERSQESPVQFRTFFKDWLFNHIIGQDIKILPYTKGKEREIRNALRR